MTKEQLIAILETNSRLGTKEQVEHFDHGLASLARDTSVGPADLSALFRVFTDSTENEEVMFGLVHYVEDFPLEDFLRGVLGSIGELERRAPGWAKLFHYRILNSERARPLYSSLLAAADDDPAREAASRVLRSIAAEEGPPLRDRAVAVISMAKL